MSEPETITTLSSEDYYDACRRIRAEGLVCESISRGRSNGEWVFKLWKPQPRPRQAELIPAHGQAQSNTAG